MTGSDILSKNQLLAFRIVCFIYFHTAWFNSRRSTFAS
jgi:hypothetical protein